MKGFADRNDKVFPVSEGKKEGLAGLVARSLEGILVRIGLGRCPSGVYIVLLVGQVVIKMSATISFIFMAFGTMLFSFAGECLLKLFNSDAILLALGIPALRILSLTFPIAAVGISLTVSFQGMGKGTYSMIMTITRQLLVLLPLAFLFSKLGGLEAVWYAFLFSETTGVLICVVFFRKIYKEQIVLLPF